ncbi:MAG: hypothetical protein HXX14_20950, partial [Bacteroidetes bacterium]|nr:hypothetical protein [Bacteroidota bacterium]
PGSIHDLTINTDGVRLKQVFNNLLDNALKFTSKGSIEFGVDRIEENRIYFYVRDTGIGISEEDKAFIFEKFRQVEESFTRKFGGIGLGLSLSKSFVEILGGKIWMESVLSNGSTFWFTLPIYTISLNDNNGSHSVEGIRNHDWSSRTVLMLDKVSPTIQYCEYVLRPTRIGIIKANDCYEAIAFLKSQNPPDVILIDSGSPRINSADAIKLLTRIAPDVPILVQSIKALHKNGGIEIEEDIDNSPYNPIQSVDLIEKLNYYFNHTS